MEKRKTKATVRMVDGTSWEVTGDTVIVFTINDAQAFMEGKVDKIGTRIVVSGTKIPVPVFAQTIGELVGSFIRKINDEEKNPATTAFVLHEVGQVLERQSQEIVDEISLEDAEKELQRSTWEFFETLLGV